jgi:hypothetical protein
MTTESVCFAALPASLPPALAEAVAAQDVAVRRLALAEGADQAGREIEARFLAPRLLPRLFREPAQAQSQLDGALAGADRLIVLLPTGRYDDGVWAPIIERILLGLAEAAARPREIVLAWSGLEPFLVPFGRRAQEIWSDPRLAPGLLGVLERSARSLAAVLDGAVPIRRGLIRFEAAQDGEPARAALALA